jgi:hypothetical protein
VATDSGNWHKRVKCCRILASVFSSASITVDDALEIDRIDKIGDYDGPAEVTATSSG